MTLSDRKYSLLKVHIPKKMIPLSVVLPGMNSEGKRTEFNPLSDHDGLIERYKSKNLDGVLEVSPFTALFISRCQQGLQNNEILRLMRQCINNNKEKYGVMRFSSGSQQDPGVE